MKYRSYIAAAVAIAFPIGIVFVICGGRVVHEPWLLISTVVLGLANWNLTWSFTSILNGVEEPGAVGALGSKLSGGVVAFLLSVAGVVLAIKTVHIWEGVVTLTAILALGGAQMTHRVVAEKVNELTVRIEAPSSHSDWGVRLAILAGRASENSDVSGQIAKFGDDTRFLARDVYGAPLAENEAIERTINVISGLIDKRDWDEVTLELNKLRRQFDERELVLRHHRSGK